MRLLLLFQELEDVLSIIADNVFKILQRLQSSSGVRKVPLHQYLHRYCQLSLLFQSSLIIWLTYMELTMTEEEVSACTYIFIHVFDTLSRWRWCFILYLLAISSVSLPIYTTTIACRKNKKNQLCYLYIFIFE